MQTFSQHFNLVLANIECTFNLQVSHEIASDSSFHVFDAAAGAGAGVGAGASLTNPDPPAYSSGID